MPKLKLPKSETKTKTTISLQLLVTQLQVLYTYVNQVEPITILNADGTGIIQNEDLAKENIIWGIECSESGIPIFKEGFNSASYSFWYKKSDTPNPNQRMKTNGFYNLFQFIMTKRKCLFLENE